MSPAVVSVVIPAYNSGEFVADAIESVYAQTVRPAEVIVVDDGSTDDTPQIINRFEGRPGFTFVRQVNRGEASARNAGIACATGDYVALLDHDDLWRADKLERQLAHFDPTWGMSFTAYERKTPWASELVAHRTWDPDPRAVLSLLEQSAVLSTCSTWLIRREALRRVGGFETVAPFGTDWLMALRLASAGLRVGYLPEPLTQYRVHGSNLSRDVDGTFLDCACAVFDRYGDRRLRAWRRLLVAVYAHEHGDQRRARHRILEAAYIRPLSIRPGWLRLLL
jgi:glycosyltransferase involved in cell wall biosynthesis